MFSNVIAFEYYGFTMNLTSHAIKHKWRQYVHYHFGVLQYNFQETWNKLYTYLYSYTSLQNHLVTHPCGRFQNLNICINKNVYAYIYIFLYFCVRMCLCVSHGNWMLTYTHDLFHLLNSLDDTLIDRNESLTFWKWKFFPHLSFLFN